MKLIALLLLLVTCCFSSTFSFPRRPDVNSSPHKLVIASQKVVHATSLDLMSQPKIIHRMGDYSESDNITDLGMHVDKNLVFISDTSGNIRKIKLDSNNKKELILKGKQFNITNGINQLSIDWLNDKIYLVADHAIYRADLDGSNLIKLISGFNEEPKNMIVDPINGYLYWALGVPAVHGIYWIDLSLIEEIVISKKSALSFSEATKFITDERSLNIFTVNFEKFQIFYPGKTPKGNIVIISATPTLNQGQHLIKIRDEDRIETSKFGSDFKGLLHFNGSFYWTDGKRFFREEFHPESNRFYHNEFYLPDSSGSDLVSAIILHPDQQQIPKPIYPIRELGAVFTDTTAKAYWQRPKVLPGRGLGAFNGWKYELSVRATNETTSHVQDNLIDIQTKIAQLTPNTEYEIKVRPYSKSGKGNWSAPYTGWTSSQPAHWERSIGEAPSVPEIKEIDLENNVIIWSKSEGNGADIIFYELYLKDLSDSSSQGSEKWNIVFNGTATFWSMSGIPSNSKFAAKIRAKSRFGFSNFNSQEVVFSNFKPVAVRTNHSQAFPLIAAVCLTVAIVVSFIYARSIRLKNEMDQSDESIKRGSPPDDLVPLPQLPGHPHQHNVLYVPGYSAQSHSQQSHQSDKSGLSSIPKVNGNQIRRTRELGQGAFGKVFEGTVDSLWGPQSGSTRVAIKTLQEEATEQEKLDFLKEARLMGNFNHPHILKLLAVCLDRPNNSLILELMEGGDLLKYLRANRPTEKSPSTLTMSDLISICVDVAKGCKYLEDMHFVHRDLAARNCLVTMLDNNQRIVKIGDFGLARDVYKSEYYKKDGSAKVPVRWMAPESLIDGIFTTQSDIWSFGVLLWEVVTMGERPYPGHTNHTVIYHVKRGGYPDAPECCPDQLYSLMKLCWSRDADKRPSFAMCLQRLQDMKDSVEFTNQFISNVPNHAYIRQFISNSDTHGTGNDEGRIELILGRGSKVTHGTITDSGITNSQSIKNGTMSDCEDWIFADCDQDKDHHGLSACKSKIKDPDYYVNGYKVPLATRVLTLNVNKPNHNNNNTCSASVTTQC